MTSVDFRLSAFRLLSGAALASVLLTPVLSLSQDQSSAPTKTSPDNSAVNQTAEQNSGPAIGGDL